GERGMPRFSPGYGDLPLSVQRSVATLLGMEKTLGVCLSDSLLMSPSKSVTAFVGVSDTAHRSTVAHHCARCNLDQCMFRGGV
ncbi:MAG: Vitamin B12 dependent methionine synthase activation subunit, partial [Clostridia bacterium]|nr:Vitamin B12 dependent methionine synthase activation subunit [Clostridia bacterium]